MRKLILLLSALLAALPVTPALALGALGGSAFPLTFITSNPINGTDEFNELLYIVNQQCTTAVSGQSAQISNIAQFVPVASAVNQFIFTNSATGGLNTLAVGTGTGSGADATAPILLGGNATGKVYLGGTTAANSGFEADAVTSGVNHFISTGTATAGLTTLAVGGTGADATAPALFGGNSTGSVYLGGTTAANAAFKAQAVASGVNQFIATGTITSGLTSLAVGGSGADATAPALFAGNSTGKVYLGGTTAANSGFESDAVSSGVNHVIATGSAPAGLTTLKVGGTGADATAPLLIGANGTGTTYLGGSTAANAPFSAIPGSTNVNQIIATGTNTAGLSSVTVGGSGADATAPALFAGNTTGIVYVGNTSTANSPVKVISGSTNVNQIVLTGTNTGTAPTITVGGSGGDANRQLILQGSGTGIVNLGQTVCTVSASGNAGTCNGQKGVYTTASLSTAHSAASTAQVITNSSVTANSVVMCTVNAYSGTIGTNGNPTVICIPTSNTITATVVNAADTNALSGTVGIGFVVMN